MINVRVNSTTMPFCNDELILRNITCRVKFILQPLPVVQLYCPCRVLIPQSENIVQFQFSKQDIKLCVAALEKESFITSNLSRVV